MDSLPQCPLTLEHFIFMTSTPYNIVQDGTQNTILIFIPELNVLACQQCGRMLTSLTFLQHLQYCHWPLADIYDIPTLQQSIGSLKPRICATIPAYKYYFEFLKTIMTGLKCSVCDFVTASRQDITAHVRSHIESVRPQTDMSVCSTSDPPTIMEQVPIQVFTGLEHGTALYFIPKLSNEYNTNKRKRK